VKNKPMASFFLIYRMISRYKGVIIFFCH
jgi:hypothetical protein